MLSAVQAFLDLLDPAARRLAQLPFGSEERFHWSYVPEERDGLPVQAMSMAQRRVLHALLRSTLSAAGYLKATGIMHLEQVLGAMEGGNPQRDPEHFYLTIFGSPSPDAPWGWRLEGHHVSLNITLGGAGMEVAVTPAFFGANPAEVRSGPWAGWRVLAPEEDLARRLLQTLDDAQNQQVMLAAHAPRDIITGTDRIARLARFEGLASERMSTAQRDLLLRLIAEYTHNLAPEIAQPQFDRIVTAGVDRLYFGWAGSAAPGEPHYYRIHGPRTLIEYDNTQNEANHVHTVWRDLERDWGGDALAQHYADGVHAHD